MLGSRPHPFFVHGRILFVLLTLCCGLARAEDVLTLDFPITAAGKTLPAHLVEAPRQVAAPDGRGYAEISLRPEEGDQDLLVTVVFDEDGGKGPLLLWLGTAGQLTLSEDLAEGVVGPNQRTMRVPAEASASPGRLIVQGDQSKIHRVRLDWTAQRRVLAAADQRPVSFLMGDRVLQNTDLTGSPVLSPPDAWLGRVFEASLQEEKESLGEGVQFAVTLDQEVTEAVLSVKVLGLPLDQSLQVWVNDHPVGRVQPAVPALADPGYLTDGEGRTAYAGWRTGTVFLPRHQLHEGENSVTLASPGGRVFIRDAALQLRAAKAEEAVPSTAPDGDQFSIIP